MDYYIKYKKYKSKYLELKNIAKDGQNTIRRKSMCERTYNCKHIIENVETMKSMLKKKCNKMELLERSPMKDSKLDDEYKILLSSIERFLNVVKELDIKIPESSCKK